MKKSYMCPRYMFTFTFEYITGEWSFYCVYADTLEAAKKKFENIPEELYFIKSIDQTDNWFTPKDLEYEPEKRVYSV